MAALILRRTMREPWLDLKVLLETTFLGSLALPVDFWRVTLSPLATTFEELAVR